MHIHLSSSAKLHVNLAASSFSQAAKTFSSDILAVLGNLEASDNTQPARNRKTKAVRESPAKTAVARVQPVIANLARRALRHHLRQGQQCRLVQPTKAALISKLRSGAI